MRVSNVTRGGLLASLSFIFIYLSSILPTNKLSMLTISSFIIIISIITTNIKTSIIVFVSVSFLSFFILPSKGIAFTYILFFGLYGFIKYYIEKIRNIPIELILKFVFFNISIFLLFFLYKSFFIGEIILLKNNFSIQIILIIAQIGFFIFDYILTLFISYYNKRFISKF